MRFAIATAMRLDEICHIAWEDFDPDHKMLLVRDRKDVSDYDACVLVHEQKEVSKSSKGRIFPYNSRSVGTAFRRTCRALEITDLHFHDLRHEGASRLFEAGVGGPGHRPSRLEDASSIYAPRAGAVACSEEWGGGLNSVRELHEKKGFT